MAENYNLKSIFNSDRVREKGMFRFILEIGIIRFALPLTILIRTVSYLLKYGWTAANLEELLSVPNIYYFLGEVLMEGIIFGSIVWHWGKQEEYPKLNR
jgi:hypothetical protein